MNIKILGSGCKKCEKLYKLTEKIVQELGIETELEKVTDFKEIVGYGIMKTPGLVINEQVQTSGSVPSKKAIKKYIENNL